MLNTEMHVFGLSDYVGYLQIWSHIIITKHNHAVYYKQILYINLMIWWNVYANLDFAATIFHKVS